VRAATGSYAWALAILGGFLALSGILALIVARRIEGPPPAERVADRPTSRARG